MNGERNRQTPGERTKIMEKLLDYHKGLLGDELPLFREWMAKPLRKAIRVNPIRTGADGFKDELSAMGATPIPWCPGGFWVKEGVWGATIPHQLGYYYIQEATSMVPAEALGANAGDTILDMAAAPGSKTTQLAPRCSTIVANEPDPNRRKALFSNLNRCGVMNAIITGYDGTRFPGGGFDKVLLDAPCSNIGAARKNKDILKEWSLNRSRKIATLQKRLLKSAFDLLRPGGALVYSTCTTTLEENEEVVLELLAERADSRLETVDLPIASHQGVLPGTEKCLRIWPWDNDTEAFFVARIAKGEKNSKAQVRKRLHKEV